MLWMAEWWAYCLVLWMAEWWDNWRAFATVLRLVEKKENSLVKWVENLAD